MAESKWFKPAKGHLSRYHKHRKAPTFSKEGNENLKPMHDKFKESGEKISVE